MLCGINLFSFHYVMTQLSSMTVVVVVDILQGCEHKNGEFIVSKAQTDLPTVTVPVALTGPFA